VRLTLRTLLAYLDDTLEPSEIKRIGQKVSESDTAQELIARIKQVTRRRRITTPPATGPNAFDPNMVAEYLDSELPPEQIAELEKICLESDVHLAEVASCHQILTLVLGEPALVPPKAKERMYGLVQGREAIPFRKAAQAGAIANAPTRDDADADEMFLLGLPFYRRGSWLRWALPVAGVLLLAIVAIALWQSIRSLSQPTPPPTQVADTSKPDQGDAKKPDDEAAKKPDNKDATKPDQTENKKPENADTKKTESNGTSKANGGSTKPIQTPEEKRLESSPADRKKLPLTDRLALGSYHFDSRSSPSLLVSRKDDKDEWHRLTPGSRVYSNDQLISLPGYASELRLENEVRLLLRGHVREFSLFPEMDYLQESAVSLHKNPDVDTDLTLQRGRLYISNHKDKDVVVRFRFEKEVWDVTLHPGAEIVCDLLKRYRSDINYQEGEEPAVTLHFVVTAGNVGLVIEGQHYPNLQAPPGAAYFKWENKPTAGAGPGPVVLGPNRVEKLPNFFDKVLPMDTSNRFAEGMELALKQLSQKMLSNRPPTLALEEVLHADPGNQPAPHMLSIYCLGALDEIKSLIRILGSTDTVQRLDRDTAIFTLRRWLGRDARSGPRLYDAKNNSGLLISSGQEYRSSQAQTVFMLLHDYSPDDIINPDTYYALATYLLSDKVAIAELAHWHLVRLPYSVKVPELQSFDATAPREDRERTAAAVRKAVEKATETQSPREPGSPRPPTGKQKEPTSKSP
jgi:hypothetical protein